MDPKHCGQDLIRCDLCETSLPSSHCDLCYINLCLVCEEDHLSDKSKEHKIVPFNKRGSTVNYPICQKHSQRCELHCKHCNIPICHLCDSSGEHERHKKVNTLKHAKSKKELIEKDLKELKNFISPKYKEAATYIPVQRANVRKHSLKLKAALDKQEEALRKEISNIFKRKQSTIDDMDKKHLTAIDKQERAINRTRTEITRVIFKLQNLLDSDDVCLVSEYTSRNEEFRSLPAQFKVTLPTFTPQEINREQIYNQIGSLSTLAIRYLARPLINDPAILTEKQCHSMKTPGADSSLPTQPLIDDPAIPTEEHGGPMNTPVALSSPPARSLMDDPRILTDFNTDINTRHEGCSLCSVSCLSDSELWTIGYRNKTMRLYNLQGRLVKSVETESGNYPSDITVTRGGDLVYTDYTERSVNLVSSTKIQTLIKLRGWRPKGVYWSSSGDLLVFIDSDDGKQTKVMRYSGSTEKQSIQLDDEGKRLYTPGSPFKYLTENRNFDICVADSGAHAVVVVNAAGKLRYRYTGPSFAIQEPFSPRSITTDSHSHILTADRYNNCIHIMDRDGHFLRYIDNCELQRPWCLCVDSKDNLFVAEQLTGKVKKIQYYN